MMLDAVMAQVTVPCKQPVTLNKTDINRLLFNLLPDEKRSLEKYSRFCTFVNTKIVRAVLNNDMITEWIQQQTHQPVTQGSDPTNVPIVELEKYFRTTDVSPRDETASKRIDNGRNDIAIISDTEMQCPSDLSISNLYVCQESEITNQRRDDDASDWSSIDSETSVDGDELHLTEWELNKKEKNRGR